MTAVEKREKKMEKKTNAESGKKSEVNRRTQALGNFALHSTKMSRKSGKMKYKCSLALVNSLFAWSECPKTGEEKQ